jgi:hypothetical protein
MAAVMDGVSPLKQLGSPLAGPDGVSRVSPVSWFGKVGALRAHVFRDFGYLPPLHSLLLRDASSLGVCACARAPATPMKTTTT